MKTSLKIGMYFLAMALILSVSACDTLEEAGLVQSKDQGLRASGMIEVVDVVVSSDQGGILEEVYVSEGDVVSQGDRLFKLVDDVLDAQKRQAQAAYEAAEAGLGLANAVLAAAQVNADIAKLQYEIELESARRSGPTRDENWKEDQPEAFDLPPWYFIQDEEIQSAWVEMQEAKGDLEDELESFQGLQDSAVFSDLESAELRLSDAQAAYLVAEEVRDKAEEQDNQDLRDFSQQDFDSAEAELEAAQTAYDQLLSDTASQDVFEARARLAIAEERHQTALDHYYDLLTGEHALPMQLASLTVKQAEANVLQAQAAVDQAQKMLAQAQAERDLIDVYMDKLMVKAPISGVIRMRGVEPGEVLQPGVTAIIIDQMDELTLTVYFPENQYGKIDMGDQAEVRVDSFPDEVFEGVVIRIADRAEYTPRNVQTQEERVTTVYAVKLSVRNKAGKLKPGMPADAVFEK